MMVVVISVGKYEIMCVWYMYVLCVYALCVTLQELTISLGTVVLSI